MSTAIQQDEIENFFNRSEARFNDALSGEEPDIEETVNSLSARTKLRDLLHSMFFTSSRKPVMTSGSSLTSQEMNNKPSKMKGWCHHPPIGLSAIHDSK